MTVVPFIVYIAAPRGCAALAKDLAAEIEEECEGAYILEDWYSQELPIADSATGIKLQCEIAHRQAKAVKAADFFIFIRGPLANGACIEYGMALAWHGPERCFVLDVGGTGSHFDRLALGQGRRHLDAIEAVARAMAARGIDV